MIGHGGHIPCRSSNLLYPGKNYEVSTLRHPDRLICNKLNGAQCLESYRSAASQIARILLNLKVRSALQALTTVCDSMT